MTDQLKKILRPYILVLLFIGIFLLAFSWFGRHQMFALFDAQIGRGKFMSFSEQLADSIQSKDVEAYLSHFDSKNKQLREREKEEFEKLLEGIQPDSVKVYCLPHRPGGNEVELLVDIRSDGESTRHKYDVSLARKGGKWFIKSKEEVVFPNNKTYWIHVKQEEVYSFDKFTIDQADFHLSVEDGVLVPGFTGAGITAVIIIGDGKVRTLELGGETNTFKALFFRLNPEDYPILIKNVKLSKMKEPFEQIHQAQQILAEGREKSFHANGLAAIPPRNTMTLRIHTERYGVLHYVNEGLGFEESKRPEKNSAQYFFEIGKSCYRLGDIKTAERYFSKALKAKKKKPWLEAKTHYTLGLVYRDKGEKEKAMEQFGKVVEMNVSDNLVNAAEKALVGLDNLR